MHIHHTPGNHRGIHKFIGKLFDNGRIKPGGPQAHRNFACVQIFRLYLLQRIHMDPEAGILGCGKAGDLQFLPNIAGEVFVCRPLHRAAIGALFQRVLKDHTVQFRHDFFLGFA